MVLKDNYTSKESDKMIVNIQCLWISIKNIVKIKELNLKKFENTGFYQLHFFLRKMLFLNLKPKILKNEF